MDRTPARSDPAVSPTESGDSGLPWRVDLVGEGMAGRLERWAAEARVTEAGRGRARRRWLRQQLQEEATAHGVLVDLAERGVVVTMQLTTGVSRQGRLVLVGRDVIALTLRDSSLVVVASAAIVAVRTGPGIEPTVGQPRPVGGPCLVDLLADLAGDRRPVAMGVAHAGHGQHLVVGMVVWVGHDVVAVRVGGDDEAATAYVPLTAVAEVVVR